MTPNLATSHYFYRLLQIAVIFFILSFSAKAQDVKTAWLLKGTITDSINRSAMAGATIQLYLAKTSAPEKTLRSGADGKFTVAIPATGSYLLKVSYQGYRTANLQVSPEKPNMDIILAKNDINLKQVTISKSKPTITLQGEKMVVDIENLEGSQTSNAFEMLKTVPGVVLENDENIRLNGQEDLTILVNGRKQAFTLAQAKQLLKAMPATNIKSIEVYNGKSVRFDAAGVGGTINIITKTAIADMYNISVANTLTLDQSASSSHSIFFNLKDDKWQLSASTSLSNRYRSFQNFSNSIFSGANPSTVNDILDNQGRTTAPNLSLSVEYQLTKKHSIGIIANSYFERSRADIDKSSTIFPVTAPYEISLVQEGRGKDNLNSFDLTYYYKLDTNQSYIKADAGFIFGANADRPLFHNSYTSLNGNEIRPSTLLAANIPLSGHQYIFQGDLEKNFNKRTSLIAGVKFTSGQIANFVNYDTLRNDLRIPDERRTDSLRYFEDVVSGYFSVKRNISKFSLQVGFRMEYTFMKNTSLTADSVFSRGYLNFFPNITVARNGTKFRQSIGLSTSIARPGYQQLNPYIRYIDELHYQVGNSNLKPGYAINLNYSVSYQSVIYLVAGFTRGLNSIFNVSRQEDNSIVSFNRPYNALNYNIIYATMSANFELFKIWTGSLSLTGTNMKYNIKPEFLTNTRDQGWLPMASLSNSNSFKLANKFYLEQGFYYYTGRKYYQTEVEPRWQLNAGLRYRTWKDRLSLAFNASDIFKTINSKGLSYYDGYLSDFGTNSNSRRFRFGATFNLGKLKANTTKSGSSESELERFRKGTN